MKEKITSFFRTLGENIGPFFKKLGKQLLNNICTKWVGFAIGFIAVILTVVQAAVYSGIEPNFYSANIITYSVLAVVAFLVLSVFRQTSPLAPLIMFVFNFLALLAFVSSVFTTDLLDEITTAMFGGFSLGALLKETYGQSAVLIIISMLLSAVAIYVPQNSDWLYNKILAKKNASDGACAEVK